MDNKEDILKLGVALGQAHAFGTVAGRCSAAQAAEIRRVREEKTYLEFESDWREFCPNYLGMSGVQANRLISYLDEFGPGYFQLSQLTRVSPETYRAIAPAIKDGALQLDGETIELIPENARKVAAAVAAVRKAVKPAAEPEAAAEAADPFLAARDHCRQLVEEFTALARQTRDRSRLADALGACRLRLQMLEREL